MRTNYILIDYENVQPATLASLDQEHFKVLVFVGPNQKLAVDVVIAVQQMGPRAEYITMSSNGSNALDFHIAYYLGQLAASNPKAHFHIISKDTGFDPLVQHLKSKKIAVCRSPTISDIAPAKPPTISDIAPAKPPTATSMAEQIKTIVADLQKRGDSKPGTVKTLTSTIAALFQKKLAGEQITALIEELQRRNIITISETKVTYTLRSKSKLV